MSYLLLPPDDQLVVGGGALGGGGGVLSAVVRFPDVRESLIILAGGALGVTDFSDITNLLPCP